MKTFNTSVLIEDLQTYTFYTFEVFAHYTDIFTHTRPIGLSSDSVYLKARTAQDGKHWFKYIISEIWYDCHISL